MPRSTKLFSVPELVDLVFKFLKADARSLKSCSLVCRLWAVLSGSHLFEVIKFDPRYVLESPGADTGLVPIHSWLQGKPRVVENVRRVIIDKVSSGIDDEDYPPEETLAIQIVADLYATLPRSSQWTFRGDFVFSSITHAQLASYTFTQSPAPQPGLERLEISVWHETFRTVPMSTVLGIFGEVDTLLLKARLARRMDIYHAEPDQAAPRCKVSRLALRGFSLERMFYLRRMLVAAIDLRHLQCLEVLRQSDPVSLSHVNRLLAAYARHIRRFVFTTSSELYSRYDREDNESYNRTVRQSLRFALSPCKSLRTVDMRLCFHCHRASDIRVARMHAWYNEQLWEPSVNVLLGAGALADISIYLSLICDDEIETEEALVLSGKLLRALDWNILDRVLDTHPGLQAFELRFPESTPHVHTLQQIVREQLPHRALQIVTFAPVPQLDSDS